MELFFRARTFLKHNATELGGEVAEAHALRLVDVVVAMLLVMMLTVRAHAARHLWLPGWLHRRGWERIDQEVVLGAAGFKSTKRKRSLEEFCCCHKAIE